MTDGDEYESVADRQKASQARVHKDLTKTSRERIAQITANPLRMRIPDSSGSGAIPNHLIEKAIAATYENVGYSIRQYINPEMEKATLSHTKIIENSNTLDTLAYIENLLETCHYSGITSWKDYRIPGNSIEEKKQNIISLVDKTAEKVNITLETEGVLWELAYSEGDFNFQPIGSEMMEQADGEFSVIASGKKWQSVVSPYQDAYRLYRERTYSKEIPEKLYNSIEELVQLICVDFEGWEENRNLNLSIYLDTMREMGLFEPNNIMRDEMKELTHSMERTFQKAGGDRKGHAEIDREYATLMLHQISAYLTFIIRQYEEKYE